MRKLPKLKLVYQFAPPNTADEKTIQEEVNRAFDVLFDAVLAAKSDVGKATPVSKENKTILAVKPQLDNSEQLGIS